MKSDALTDLVRNVGDDSSPEHKAIFHLWAALDDIEQALPGQQLLRAQVRGAFAAAAFALSRKESL